MGGFHKRHVSAHSSGGWEGSEMKVSGGLGFSEASLLGLQRATFSPRLPSSFCVCLCPDFLSFIRTQIGLGSTPMTSLNLIHLCQDPVSKHSHILGSWGFGLQRTNLLGRGGHNSAFNGGKRMLFPSDNGEQNPRKGTRGHCGTPSDLR